MEFGDKDFAKVVEVAFVALSAKKKAERVAKEALDIARRELKRKGKVIEARKVESRKKTMKNYFQSSQGKAGGQPLSWVFDGCLLDIPGAEQQSSPKYPSEEEEVRLVSANQSNSVFVDTRVTPGSSFASGDTMLLSVKSPLITVSDDNKEHENLTFAEVGGDSDASGDDSDF